MRCSTSPETRARRGTHGREVALSIEDRGVTQSHRSGSSCRRSRNPERGRTAERELASEGVDVRFVQLDVAEQARIDAAVAWIDEEFGSSTCEPTTPASSSSGASPAASVG